MYVIEADAPGRCGLVGNPSDMYGGCVISCTTRERAYCRLTAETVGLTLRNEDEEAHLTEPADLTLRGDKLDIARAALTYFKIEPAQTNLLLELSTEIPMRAGLSGSTAMLAAIVGAIDAWQERKLSRYALAETIRKIEARVMGVVCGHQDQHMAIFGGLNFMSFAGKEQLEQRDDEPFAVVEPLETFAPHPPLLLAHTGVQHHSGQVHQSPRDRWLAGDSLLRQSIARISELAPAGKRALIEGRWEDLGALMNENHSLVAGYGGSGPANERLLEAARNAGALGAKLAGAGGGGTILVLTHDPETLGKALLAAGAEKLYTPEPGPGLRVNRILSASPAP